MAKRPGKPLSELHIPLADLGSLSASDLLAIDGPKFITSDSERGCKTYAVLISHEKWKRLNHGLLDETPRDCGCLFLISHLEFHEEEAHPTPKQSYKVWYSCPECGRLFTMKEVRDRIFKEEGVVSSKEGQ